MSIAPRDIGGAGRVNGPNGPEWDPNTGRVPAEAEGVDAPGALSLPRITARKFGSDPFGGLDPVQALAEMGEEQRAPEDVGGLADQLLAWLMPRPRNPDTLTQARIVPLLGLAADMLARASAAESGEMPSNISHLGIAALEQELRMQRALADRRATLLRS